MKVKSMIAVITGLFFMTFFVSFAFAGIEPSPFQPQINQLHSIELNVGTIDKRIGKIPDSAADLAGKTGQLQAMASKLGDLDTRLNDAFKILPPSNTPFDGQDEVNAALDGITSDSSSIFTAARQMTEGVGPSPFLEAALAVMNKATAIVISITNYSGCFAGTNNCTGPQ